MNSTIKNIDRLQLLEPVIDLQPIYELGRTLPFNDEYNESKIPYFSVDDFIINIELVQQVKEIVKSLLHLLNKTENIFHLAFIELSLFDPKDRTGKIYYSLLIGNSKTTIDCYIKQMIENLGEHKERGAIIPHKKLHTSAFYFLSESKDENGKSALRFNELSDLPECIYVCKFNSSKLEEKNNKDELNKYITTFFQSVGRNCFKTLDDKNGKYEFNSSFLIPLFRPAALFKGEQENIYNGGGIFLYGNLPIKSNENEFVLKLQNSFTKSIFKASHTQIDFDEKDSYNSYFTALILHQLKSKLDNNVIYELSSLIKNYHLEDEIKEALNYSKDFVENLVNKLSIFLNNFQPEYKDSVGASLKYKDFENIVKEISKDKKIDYEIFNNDSSNILEMKIRKENFELIIDELFENALKYYRTYEVPIEKRKMTVQWNGIKQEKILQLLFLSENTKMSEKHLENFGNKIITGTDSSGLGGFLINYALEQNNARRFPNGKFIIPKNTASGFLVEINFITI